MIQCTCQHCGSTFEVGWMSHVRKYCNKTCSNAGRRLPDSRYRAKYRMVTVRPGHPLATPKGNRVPEHRLILWDKLGPGPHPCHYCDLLVDWLPGLRTQQGALVTDHVDRNSHNNASDNLVASCQTCNIKNRAYDVRDDEEYRVASDGRRLRGTSKPCARCGEPFVPWPVAKGKPIGKYCSKKCFHS